MAGLLNKQQDAGTMTQGAPMEGQGDAGEESNVSPEEQQAYDAFIDNGAELIYRKEAMPQLVESLRGADNPIEGLANTLAMVVMRLEDSAEKAGQEMSGDVMLHAGSELLQMLAEMSEAANIHTFSEEDQEAALYQALDIYRSTRQEEGRLPVEELQNDMQMLMQAEQSGTLDEVLPGISEYAGKVKQG
jgi:hypothetical protein